ncbi:hypothetical protein VPH35_058487 [Triticum aestivum]
MVIWSLWWVRVLAKISSPKASILWTSPSLPWFDRGGWIEDRPLRIRRLTYVGLVRGWGSSPSTNIVHGAGELTHLHLQKHHVSYLNIKCYDEVAGR